MSFLLDTCAISEYSQKVPDQAVLDWIDAQPEETLFLSALTLGEVQKGIARLQDSVKKRRIEEFLQTNVVARFAGRILPIDAEVASTWGELAGGYLRHGRPLPTIDSLIAATALVHRLRLVTRNVGNFEDLGIELVNPWPSA